MEFVAFAVFAFLATVAADKQEPSLAPVITGYNPAANLVLLPLKSADYSAPPAQGIQPQFFPSVPADVKTPEAKTSEVETVSSTTEKNAQTTAAAAEEVQTGQYYILSPEGKLQKVEYFTAAQPQTETAQKAGQYNAQATPAQFKGTVSSFQYKDVEPVTAPIYSYSNVPGPLVRILRRAEYF